MNFLRARAVSPRLEELPHTGSTNDDLVQRASGADAAGWPHLSVIVTTDQRSGRGRQGRIWVAPAGTSLAASVLLRLEGVPQERWGWIPLLAGAAMTRAVAGLLGSAVSKAVVSAAVDSAASESAAAESAATDTVTPIRDAVTLKWPNDVLIDGHKVCGILCEMLTTAVVVGSGVNVSLGADELPTATSTSLVLAGAPDADADALLAAYLTELAALVDRFVASAGDAVGAGLRDEVQRLCGTVGRDVRVELPGGGELIGTAVGIDEQGRVRIKSASDAAITAVAAGDVTHLRY